MKIRILFITATIVSLTALTSCNKEGSDPIEDIKNSITEINKIEERSNDISNELEAFEVLRDLNQEMKNIRNASLALDEQYADVKREDEGTLADDPEFTKKMEEFEQCLNTIDQSLQVIRKNVQPYEDKEEVEKMIKKLNHIMITK
jgi:predicted  nucleic acid-binding Zn-ribbon protein